MSSILLGNCDDCDYRIPNDESLFWRRRLRKKLFKNLAAVIAALVGMKVVDFLYYIASQQDFTKRAGEFIIQIAKML